MPEAILYKQRSSEQGKLLLLATGMEREPERSLGACGGEALLGT